MEAEFQTFETELKKTVAHLEQQLQSVRTSRANPSVVENISVEAYNTRSPLVALASITTIDARTLMVQPWDPSLIKSIERALQLSDLGFNITLDGRLFRLTLAPLTQENRIRLAKTVRERLEDSRISLRSQRDKMKESIIKAEKGKRISQDDRFRFLKKLDELVIQYSLEAQMLEKHKEDEIMNV